MIAKKFALALLCLTLWFCREAAAQGDLVTRGALVQWARLNTHNRHWNRHAQADPVLLHTIHDSTTLNIDTRWHAADVERLDDLCRYPFLFSEDLSVASPHGIDNVREYILRGGFIFIDACIGGINPSPDKYLADQIATFKHMFPKVVITPVPSDHEIFRDCFVLKKLPHEYNLGIYDERWAKQPLQFVVNDGHLISVISLSGLQCGWAGMNPETGDNIPCTQMFINIYLYAMTH